MFHYLELLQQPSLTEAVEEVITVVEAVVAVTVVASLAFASKLQCCCSNSRNSNCAALVGVSSRFVQERHLQSGKTECTISSCTTLYICLFQCFKVI